MRRNFYFAVLITLVIFAFFSEPLSAVMKDTCGKKGIMIRNLTMLDLWYKKNNGACTIWTHNHLFTIKPKDKIEIFSDLVCETLYCTDNPTYKDYKSLDIDGNCRVRILPDCNLSDM